MFGHHVRIQLHIVSTVCALESFMYGGAKWCLKNINYFAHLIYLIFHQFAWEMVCGSKCCRVRTVHKKTAGNVLSVLYLNTDSCSSSRNNNSMLSTLQRIGIYVARLLMWVASIIYFHSMGIKTAIFRLESRNPSRLPAIKLPEYWLKSVSVSRCWSDWTVYAYFITALPPIRINDTRANKKPTIAPNPGKKTFRIYQSDCHIELRSSFELSAELLAPPSPSLSLAHSRWRKRSVAPTEMPNMPAARTWNNAEQYVFLHIFIAYWKYCLWCDTKCWCKSHFPRLCAHNQRNLELWPHAFICRHTSFVPCLGFANMRSKCILIWLSYNRTSGRSGTKGGCWALL